MLTQDEANKLINSLKQLLTKDITFSAPGKRVLLRCRDGDNNNYILDVLRGRIKPTKATYQTRHNKSTILIRVDIDGPPHENPNGEEVPCPHIHIYREGYDDKWAYPLQNEILTNPEDLIQVLIDFFTYNNINNKNEISIQGGNLFDDS